jgi:hypothetical protein
VCQVSKQHFRVLPLFVVCPLKPLNLTAYIQHTLSRKSASCLHFQFPVVGFSVFCRQTMENKVILCLPGRQQLGSIYIELTLEDQQWLFAAHMGI